MGAGTSQVGMITTFERESVAPIVNPSAKRLASEIRKLRSYGRSTYASLTRDDDSYVQLGGGGVTCVVERRDTAPQRHFRAFSASPSVRFDDGTVLEFGGGRIPLRHDEWLNAETATDIFVAFLERKPFPPEIGWRDISEMLGLV